MKNLFFLPVFVCLMAELNAQEPAQRITEMDLQSFSEGKPIHTTSMKALYEGVKGTPYLMEDWKTGDVYFLDGTEISEINIRYNIYNDELEFKNSTSGQVFVIDRNKINGFSIREQGESSYFKYFSLKPDRPGEKSIVQVLYEGRSGLLLKHQKIFIPANYQGAYASGNKYDEYQDDKDYYLIADGETIHRIRLNKKSFLNVLRDNQSAVKEYASVNKIDFTNPGDIIKLLMFYDSKNTNP